MRTGVQIPCLQLFQSTWRLVDRVVPNKFAWARLSVTGFVLASSTILAHSADNGAPALDSCFRVGRITDAICAQLPSDSLLRTACFAKTYSVQSECVQRATSKTPATSPLPGETGSLPPLDNAATSTSPPRDNLDASAPVDAEASGRFSTKAGQASNDRSAPPERETLPVISPVEKTDIAAPTTAPASPPPSLPRNSERPSEANALRSAQKSEPAQQTCKAIGFTASGELVLSIECGNYVGKQKLSNRKPGTAEGISGKAAEVAKDELLTGSPPDSPRSGKTADQEAKPSLTERQPSATSPGDKPDSATATSAGVSTKSTLTDSKSAAGETKPAVSEGDPAATKVKPAAAAPEPTTAQPNSAGDQIKSNAADTKASREKSALAEKPAADTAPDSGVSTTTSAETVAPTRRAESKRRERWSGPPNCTQYRSYSSATGTYRGFSGQIRPCP
jgi:hypothetical protein